MEIEDIQQVFQCASDCGYFHNTGILLLFFPAYIYFYLTKYD